MQPDGVQSFALRVRRPSPVAYHSGCSQRNNTAAFLTVCQIPQRSGIDTSDQARMARSQLEGDGWDERSGSFIRPAPAAPEPAAHCMGIREA